MVGQGTRQDGRIRKLCTSRSCDQITYRVACASTDIHVHVSVSPLLYLSGRCLLRKKR